MGQIPNKMTIQIYPGSHNKSPSSPPRTAVARKSMVSLFFSVWIPLLTVENLHICLILLLTFLVLLIMLNLVDSGGMILRQNHHCFRFVFSCQETHEPVFAALMRKSGRNLLQNLTIERLKLELHSFGTSVGSLNC